MTDAELNDFLRYCKARTADADAELAYLVRKNAQVLRELIESGPDVNAVLNELREPAPGPVKPSTGRT